MTFAFARTLGDSNVPLFCFEQNRKVPVMSVVSDKVMSEDEENELPAISLYSVCTRISVNLQNESNLGSLISRI